MLFKMKIPLFPCQILLLLLDLKVVLPFVCEPQFVTTVTHVSCLCATVCQHVHFKTTRL